MSSNNNKSSSYAACLLEHERHDDDDDDNDSNINSDVLPSSRDIDNKEEDHLVSSSDGKVSSSQSRLSSNGDTSSNDKVSSQTDNDRQPPSAQTPSSFAVQLMNMLISETAIGGSSVRWLPTGNGFEIRNQELFTSLLPRYFNTTAVLQSFLRRLYRWGFKSEERATAGSGQYVFTSEIFHRDNNKYLHMKALPRSKPKTQETTTNSDDIVSSLQHSDKGDSTHAAVSSSSHQLPTNTKKSHETKQDGKIRADTSSLHRHQSERYNNSIVSSSSQVSNPHLETIPPQQQLTPQNRLLVEQLVNAMRPQTAVSNQTSGMLSSNMIASQLNNPMQQQIPPTQAALIHQLLTSQQGISILPHIQQAVSASFANTALQQHQMHQAASNHQVLLQAALLLQQHGASVFRQESTNSNDTTTTTSSDISSSNDNDRGNSTRASSSLTSNNDEDNINTSSNEDSQGLNASTSNRKRERSPTPDK